MKKFPANFRNVGSFIAGSLVGLSLGVMVFAMMDAFPDEWQTLPLFGASIILAVGIALQIVATNMPRPRRGASPEAWRLACIRFMDLNHLPYTDP